MLFPLLFDVFQVISLTIRISERRTDLVFAGIFLSNLSFCGDLPARSNQVLFQYICNRYYYYYPILSRHAALRLALLSNVEACVRPHALPLLSAAAPSASAGAAAVICAAAAPAVALAAAAVAAAAVAAAAPAAGAPGCRAVVSLDQRRKALLVGVGGVIAR